jgi:predicted hydrocarbon binding protein
MKAHGTKTALELIHHFDLDKRIFENTEQERVNHLFFEDIMGFLKTRGLSDSDVWFIGKNMIQFSRGSQFASELTSFGRPKEMLEFYLSLKLSSVEKNNEYVLHYLDDEKCILRSYEREECQDIFKRLHVGCENRCLYRAGALSAATQYLGLPSSQVTETKCVHRGDQFCQFEINYSFAEYCRKNKLVE